jgi:hypothetical protein
MTRLEQSLRSSLTWCSTKKVHNEECLVDIALDLEGYIGKRRAPTMEIKRRAWRGGAKDLPQETRNDIDKCNPYAPRWRVGCTQWMEHKPAR